MKAGPRHILVVDDDEMVLEVIRLALHSAGFHVHCTTSGNEAIDITRKNTIDLLLTDVIMPEMTGQKLVEEFRRTNPDVPVIYMSGYLRPGIMIKGKKEPAPNFIAKPIIPSKLVKKIRAIVA
jgi:CheY-like chemotaxis protein